MGAAGEGAGSGSGEHGEHAAGTGEDQFLGEVLEMVAEGVGAAGLVGALGVGPGGQGAGVAFGNGLGGGLVVGLFAGGHGLGHDDQPAGQAVDLDEAVPVFLRQVRADELEQGDFVQRPGPLADEAEGGVNAVGGLEAGGAGLLGVGVPEPVADHAVADDVPGVQALDVVGFARAGGLVAALELGDGELAEDGHGQVLDGLVEVADLLIGSAQFAGLFFGEGGIERDAAGGGGLLVHGLDGPVHLDDDVDAPFDEGDEVGVAAFDEAVGPLQVGVFAALGGLEHGHGAGDGERAQGVVLVAPAVGLTELSGGVHAHAARLLSRRAATARERRPDSNT